MAVPPSGAAFVTGALPPVVGELRTETKDLSAIHTGAIDATASVLSLVNTHDTPRFAWIDGAPMAWVAPEGRLELSPLQRGKYTVEWRNFLDDAGEPPKTLTVPPSKEPADAGAH